MQEVKLLNCEGQEGKVIYAEYGAGKAGLSSYVAQKLAQLHTDGTEFDKSKVLFLVVDRDSRRYTKDKYVKKSGF